MASEAEIAGNYAMSGGSSDPAYVAERLAEIQADTQQRERESVSQATAQAEVLHGDDPENIELSVAGETIRAEPIGLGRRARLMKRAAEADERGDEMAQIDVVLDMIDTLVDATPTEFDADWWDDRTEAQIRDAFQTLGRESAGGNA